MSLKGNLELALKRVLSDSAELPAELAETSDTPARIYMGADSEEQVRPCVVCQAQSGEEDPLGSGNFFVTVSILVKSPADIDSTGDVPNDPVALHNARSEAVFGILRVDNLGELLSAAVDGLTVYDPVSDVSMQPEIDGRSFVDGLTFRAYCCTAEID